MAFFCPAVLAKKREYKAYNLRQVRRRKLQTLSRPLLPGGNRKFEYDDDDDDDDDSDSGISQENCDRELSFFHPRPDLAKTELAARLSSASPGKPAYIKARVLWRYEPIQKQDLAVQKGAIVQLLHREGDRVFATTSEGETGFVPFSYCTVLRKLDNMTNGVPLSDVITNGHDVIHNGHDVIHNGHDVIHNGHDVIHNGNDVTARKNGHITQNGITNGVCNRNKNANGAGHIVSASKVYFHGDGEKFMETKANCRSETVENTTSLDSLPGFTTNVHRCSSDDALCHANRKQRLHRLSSSMDNVTKPNRITSASARYEARTDRLSSTALTTDTMQWDRRAPESYYRRKKLLVSHFRKYSESNVMVKFKFQGLDENDISVQRGEIVRVLNKDDQDWWWIVRDDGHEGFVPSSYLTKERLENLLETTPRSVDSSTSGSEGSSNQVRFQDPLCTIHSYIREESDNELEMGADELSSLSDEDSETNELLAESKWSTWC